MALTLPHSRPRLSPGLGGAALALATLIAAPAAGQDAPQDDPVGPAATAGDQTARWQPSTNREFQLIGIFGDHHIAVVGDELITRDEVYGFIRSRDFDDPTSRLPQDMTPADIEQAKFLAALEQMIEAQLKIQGGRNQGFEPELVEQLRDNAFERQVLARGGPTQMSAWLDGFGLTPNEFRSYIERRLLSQFWEDSVTGRSAGATGRQFVDPYIRPGQLFSRYRTYARDQDPRFGEIIGRVPARAVLRRLVISAEKEGGVEPALALAEAARDNIAKGIVEFDGVVNEYAPVDVTGEGSYIRGPTEAIIGTLERLHPGEDLRSFVESSALGDLSPLVRFDPPEGGLPFFIVYRLDERIMATEASPFLDLGLQTKLRESMEEEEDAIRVARGLSELVRSTYVAPLEIRDALLQRGRRRRN